MGKTIDRLADWYRLDRFHADVLNDQRDMPSPRDRRRAAEANCTELIRRMKLHDADHDARRVRA